MIEGPLSGSTGSDATSAALAATVAGNTSSMGTKAPTTTVDALAQEVTLKAPTTTVDALTVTVSSKAAATDLTAAEASIATHSGEIAAVTSSANNIGTSFYNKTLTDALLSGKVDDGQVLTNVPSGAHFTDTVYSHPA